jgi:hypothetical protein
MEMLGLNSSHIAIWQELGGTLTGEELAFPGFEQLLRSVPPKSPPLTQPKPAPPPLYNFQAGEKIFSPHFGNGLVLGAEPYRDDLIVTIQFQKLGIKKLFARAGRLRPLNPGVEDVE